MILASDHWPHNCLFPFWAKTFVSTDPITNVNMPICIPSDFERYLSAWKKGKGSLQMYLFFCKCTYFCCVSPAFLLQPEIITQFDQLLYGLFSFYFSVTHIQKKKSVFFCFFFFAYLLISGVENRL